MRQIGRRSGAWGALAAAVVAAGGGANAQTWPGQPPMAPETQAALAKLKAGDASELRRLADGGSVDAQYYLGNLLVVGVPAVPKDGAKGCAMLAQVAKVRADAQHLVGECYQYGYGGEKDPEKALAAFHKAGDMGFPKSRCAEGNVLFALGRDEARGLALCLEGARAGDPDAQADVGNFYVQGKHVAKDTALARAWYEMAVSGGRQRNAAFTLGQIYWFGEAVPRTPAKAAFYWKIAYDGGRADAAILLGDEAFVRAFPDAGPGKPVTTGQTRVVPAAMKEAINWYEKARAGGARRDDLDNRIKVLDQLLAKLPADQR